jgi:hypothetical protein
LCYIGASQQLQTNSGNIRGKVNKDKTVVTQTFLEHTPGCMFLILYKLSTLPQNYSISGIFLKVLEG